MQQAFIDLIQKEIPQDDSTHQGEKLFLYGLVRAIVPRVVVETGTHRGKTTAYLGQAVRENGIGHVYSVDPYDWGQPGNFRKTGLDDVVTYQRIRGDELEVDNIDLLFIDGYHGKEDALQEIVHLFPKLTKEAVVVFHDCWDPRENEPEMVNAAIREAGLQTIFIPSFNAMRVYGKGSDYRPGYYPDSARYDFGTHS